MRQPVPSKENYNFCFVFFFFSVPQTELGSRAGVAGPPSTTWLQESVFLGSTGSCLNWISWLESTQGIIFLKMSDFYQLTTAPPPAGGDVTQSLQLTKLGFALSWDHPPGWKLCLGNVEGEPGSAFPKVRPYTHTYRYTHVYIYAYVDACVYI